jgi:tRNA (cmo5U34)-methyltransferase
MPVSKPPSGGYGRDEFFYVGEDNYDEHAEVAIPGYRHLHMAMVDLLERTIRREQAVRVLDLGVGTGKTSGCVLEAFPGANVVGVDLFDEMLAHARARLAAFGSRVRLVQGDFMRQPLGTDYDLCVSALGIHHQDAAGKQALFARVYDALAPGGQFCMIDWVKFGDPRRQQAALEAAAWHVRRAAPSVADEWEDHWRHKNRPDTEEDLCDWLVEAGFDFTFSAVRHYGIALVHAVKADRP